MKRGTLETIRAKVQLWLRTILGIDKAFNEIMCEFQEVIGERTTVHTDLHYKQDSMIIVIGEYRKRDYVRCFHMEPCEMGQFIDHMHHKEKFFRVGRFDEPRSSPFKAILERGIR